MATTPLLPVKTGADLTFLPSWIANVAQADNVSTSSITSTTYVDGSGGGGGSAGPSLSVDVGPTGKLLVIVSADMLQTASQQDWASFQIDAGVTLAPLDMNAASFKSSGGATQGVPLRFTRMTLVTGLALGTHLVAMMYRVSGGTGTFTSRRLIAVPL